MKAKFSAQQKRLHQTLVTLTISLACLTFTPAALAGSEFTPARIEEIAKLLPARPAGFGSPITDRAAWDKLAALPEAKKAVADAERVAAKPIPDQPDELFLDFSKTGNRDRWQNVAFERRRRVATLTLGECFENQGRFLKPLEAVIAELCREKTWVYPAHDKSLANFNGTAREMDLGAVFVAMELAEADYLLGDKLSADTRQLIRDNVRRRVLHPFREMAEGKVKEMGWMRSVHNWNAVCLGSITIAALALEDVAGGPRVIRGGGGALHPVLPERLHARRLLQRRRELLELRLRPLHHAGRGGAPRDEQPARPHGRPGGDAARALLRPQRNHQRPLSRRSPIAVPAAGRTRG